MIRGQRGWGPWEPSKALAPAGRERAPDRWCGHPGPRTLGSAAQVRAAPQTAHTEEGERNRCRGGTGRTQDSPLLCITPALPPDPLEVPPSPPLSSSGWEQADASSNGGFLLGKPETLERETQTQGRQLSRHLPIPPNFGSRNLKAPLVLAAWCGGVESCLLGRLSAGLPQDLTS